MEVTYRDFENLRVEVENPKIPEKNFPKNWGLGLGPPILELKWSLSSPIARYQNCPQKPLGGGDVGGRNLNFGQLLPEIGELWSTFLAF